jgi:hypothetical protein
VLPRVTSRVLPRLKRMNETAPAGCAVSATRPTSDAATISWPEAFSWF